MNYYEHHLGDWAAATGHLTWDEDMAYTRLLRAYYHQERPIPQGQQYRLAKASTPAQRRAVDAVLEEFFSLVDGEFRQKRADAEIARFQDKQRKAKASADARWSQTGRNANASANAMRTHSEGNAHQTPDTRHQSPDPEKDTRTAISTDGGRVCLALKRTGLAGLNPGHPDLLALIAAGATEAEFVGAALTAVDRGKGFAYALGMLKRQRLDAAQSAQAMHSGSLPQTTRTATASERRTATVEAFTGQKASHDRPEHRNVVDIAARVVD